MAVIIKQVPWIFLLLPHSFVLLQPTSSSFIISHHITTTSSIDLLNLLLSIYTHIHPPINLSIYLPTHKIHIIHYTILFHAITYHTTLYTMPYHTILDYIILYHTIVFYSILYSTIPVILMTVEFWFFPYFLLLSFYVCEVTSFLEFFLFLFLT